MTQKLNVPEIIRNYASYLKGYIRHRFHFPLITFWQAVGLLILTRLLFGSFCHHGRGHHLPWGHDFRNKLETITPEEREQFMKMRHSCRPWSNYCYAKKEENATDSLKG